MAPRTARQRQLLDTHRKEITAGTGADAEVHANDKKLFEALKAKQDKVEALKFEISRIRVKEWEDGLTAGMFTCTYTGAVAGAGVADMHPIPVL